LVRESVDEEVVNLVKQTLGVERAEFDAGRSHALGVFESIHERYVKRMGDWNKRMLSQIVKEVLIKDATQVLPTYAMSVFKLPSVYVIHRKSI
jgi:hypothetical protein